MCEVCNRLKQSLYRWKMRSVPLLTLIALTHRIRQLHTKRKSEKVIYGSCFRCTIDLKIEVNQSVWRLSQHWILSVGILSTRIRWFLCFSDHPTSVAPISYKIVILHCAVERDWNYLYGSSWADMKETFVAFPPVLSPWMLLFPLSLFVPLQMLLLCFSTTTVFIFLHYLLVL